MKKVFQRTIGRRLLGFGPVHYNHYNHSHQGLCRLAIVMVPSAHAHCQYKAGAAGDTIYNKVF
jgi:hypothetical protein